MIALAIEGQQFPSEKFSQTLEEVTVRGYSEITFVIGGSLGLSPAVKKTSEFTHEFWKINPSPSIDEACFDRTNLSGIYDSTGKSLP